MTDLDKALAALRASINRVDPNSPPEISFDALIAVLGASVDLVAAIDAARGEAVAWYRPSEEGYDSAFRDASTVARCNGHDWAGWVPLYAAPPAAAVPTDFAEWLAREMPAGTVIGDPHWWAKLIARRFAQFAATQTPPAAPCVCGEPALGVVHRADGPCYLPEQAPPAALAVPAIPKALRDEWRSERGNSMTSAVGEYTPREFWDLLDAYEALLAQQPAAAVPEVLPPLPNPCHVHNVGGRIAYSWTADVVTRYAQSALLAAAQAQQPAAAVPEGGFAIVPADALREVIRISDRSHPAWDAVKAAMLAERQQGEHQ